MTDGRKHGLASAAYSGWDLTGSMAMLEMSKRDVAALCGVTVRAVELWMADERPIPPLVRRVLKGAALGLVSIRTLQAL